jgi:endonuclease/exonuclease/phosphatase family metal-dependent hydrolase
VFNLKTGEKVSILAVHFPAPFHPKKYRQQAAEFLNKIASESNDDLTIVGGDFNITSEEDKSGNFHNKYFEKHWDAAHLQCNRCKGTNYYPPKNSWSFLDRLMLYKPTKKQWKIRNVKVWNKTSEQVTHKKTPKRFSYKSKSGVSDHWPLVMELTK